MGLSIGNQISHFYPCLLSLNPTLRLCHQGGIFSLGSLIKKKNIFFPTQLETWYILLPWFVQVELFGWLFFVYYLVQPTFREVFSLLVFPKKMEKQLPSHRLVDREKYQLISYLLVCLPLRHWLAFYSMFSYYPLPMFWWRSPGFCLRILPVHFLEDNKMWNGPRLYDIYCRNLSFFWI